MPLACTHVMIPSTADYSTIASPAIRSPRAPIDPTVAPAPAVAAEFTAAPVSLDDVVEAVAKLPVVVNTVPVREAVLACAWAVAAAQNLTPAGRTVPACGSIC